VESLGISLDLLERRRTRLPSNISAHYNCAWNAYVRHYRKYAGVCAHCGAVFASSAAAR